MPDLGPSGVIFKARRLGVVLLFLGALAACSPIADRSGVPTLLPIDDLLAQVAPPTEDPGPALARRAAALKARAAALTP